MDGATVVLVAVSDTVAAALSIKDPVKPEAGRVVAALQNMGIQVGLLSKDSLEMRMCNKGQICENKSISWYTSALTFKACSGMFSARQSLVSSILKGV